MRGFRHWRWYLDEIHVKLNGEMLHLWRAFDVEDKVLEGRIGNAAMLRVIRKALKPHG